MNNTLEISVELNTGLYYIQSTISAQQNDMIRDNPDMNFTFLGDREAHVDAYMGCYYSPTGMYNDAVFVGAILGNWAQRETQHMEMHPAIDRVNYKATIPIFTELSIIYALQRGWRPCTAVPDSMVHVHKWLKKMHGLTNGIPMQSTRNILGKEVTSTLYTVPDDWQPQYFTSVYSAWATQTKGELK